MRNGSGGDAISPHQLAEALLFPVAHLFGRIDNNRGQALSLRR